MKEVLISFAQNSEATSMLISVLTLFMSILAVSSLFTTRKMFKARRKAEKQYIELLLRDKAFIEFINNSKNQEILLRNYTSNDLDIFIHVFEGLDLKAQEQIEPALFQRDSKNRKAYMKKVVNEAKKLMELDHSHC